MFVKKFEAPSLEEAIVLVKNEFGPNALILSTNKKTTKWYEKPRVEVTAAMDKKEEPQQVKKVAKEEKSSVDEKKLAEIFPYRKTSQFDGYAAEIRPSRSLRYVDIQEEEKRAAVPPVLRKFVKERERNESAVNENEYVEHFLKLGFSNDTAKDFSRRISYEHSKAELKKDEFFTRVKARLLHPNLRVMSKEELADKKNIILIGLPGVGKTTMLVKLAMFMRKEKGSFPKGFCFIAQDDRKVSGRQELMSYAKLLKTQCHLKFPERAEDGKFQLIDAPALSMNPEENRELERLCDGRFSVLVLDGTQRVSEMLRVLDRSQRLLPRAIAFTRLDYVMETGALYEVLRNTNLPLLGSCQSASFRKNLKTYNPENLSQYLVSGKVAYE